MVIDSVDLLSVFMGDEGSHGGSGVRREDDTVLANDTYCSGQVKAPIFGNLRFSNLSCVQLFLS
jgi:hypothetical protein